MKQVVVLSSAIVCSGVLANELGQRALTFEDRVQAQQAIERVGSAHRLGATKSFDKAVPKAVLENKVCKYLERTAVLDGDWKTPVTDGMLQRELERMAEATRMPERLLELHTTLVDRLPHNVYAFDQTLHAAARRRAEGLRKQIAEGTLDPASEHPDRTVVDFVLREPNAGEPAEGERQPGLLDANDAARRELSPEEFQRERARWDRTRLS